METSNIKDCINITGNAGHKVEYRRATAELERLENIDKNADNLIAQIQLLQNKVDRLEAEKKELTDALKAIFARMAGDFDAPELTKFGALSSQDADISRIITKTIKFY